MNTQKNINNVKTNIVKVCVSILFLAIAILSTACIPIPIPINLCTACGFNPGAQVTATIVQMFGDNTRIYTADQNGCITFQTASGVDCYSVSFTPLQGPSRD